MRRGRGVLIAAVALLVLLASAVLLTRWVLRPDNLARVIAGWVERELEAQLALSEPPGLRLVPRLELTLSGVQLERNATLLGSAAELRVALPWSTLWSGGMRIESLTVREPVIDWPQLRVLLAELSDARPQDRARAAPRLPDIAVGVRVEDGVLHAGTDLPAWRIDRIALVTTPLHDGQPFHLDAGARLVGAQSRTLSLTVSARPQSGADSLSLEDIALRIVISPDARPLADGMTLSLAGSMRLSERGLTALALRGDVPGWPDWLPAALGFGAWQPVDIEATLPDGGDRLSLSLRQSGHEAGAEIHVADVAAAMSLADRPLAAIASLRSRWRIDAVTAGGVRAEGIRIDIGSPSAAAAEVAAGADRAPFDGDADVAADADAGSRGDRTSGGRSDGDGNGANREGRTATEDEPAADAPERNRRGTNR
jgi:hypothetical protein